MKEREERGREKKAGLGGEVESEGETDIQILYCS